MIVLRRSGSSGSAAWPATKSQKPRQLLRSPWDMLHSAAATEYFPLSLTLSLRERGQLPSDGCLANNCWANSGTVVIERRWTILPLRKGEGRGEGEAGVAHPPVKFVIAVRCASGDPPETPRFIFSPSSRTPPC